MFTNTKSLEINLFDLLYHIDTAIIYVFLKCQKIVEMNGPFWKVSIEVAFSHKYCHASSKFPIGILSQQKFHV